jgi:ankyrin repeat protein
VWHIHDTEYSRHHRAIDGQDLRLIEAAKYGDVRKVRALISEGVDVNDADARGVTALIAASRAGNLPAVQLLLHAGADASAKLGYRVIKVDHAGEHGAVNIYAGQLMMAGLTARGISLLSLLSSSRTRSGMLVPEGYDLRCSRRWYQLRLKPSSG